MDTVLISAKDFSARAVFGKMKNQRAPRGNPHGRKKQKYKDVVCAFDIETSTLPDMEQAIMYIWQFQIGDICTVFGRTWEEYFAFLRQIREEIRPNLLCIYVHNLSFEFQFLKGLYDFQEDEVFAVDSRKVLKCTMWSTFEYRCSYLHSNMSLDAFTHRMGVPAAKLHDFDYDKVRYPWTPLTPDEMDYCINDVQGLVQALEKEMKMDGDTLYTIPLTSTGYVRRDCKKAMENFNHAQLAEILPDADVYALLREAFRGGNTHANRWYSGDILHDVHSIDLVSAYPSVMINYEFPMTQFVNVGEIGMEKLQDLMYHKHKALLFRLALWDVKLISRYTGAPYLSRDKCRSIVNGHFDNGRILDAEYLETTVTDIDMEIILGQYDFSGSRAWDVHFARYGKLPQMFRDVILQYFDTKTKLKRNPGDPENEEQEYFYQKSKNKLNSLYGMTAQDPAKLTTVFTDGEFIIKDESAADILRKNYKKAFLSYAWGVWVTARCRWILQQGIDAAGDRFVYCDTDSVKTIGTVDMTEYNVRTKKLAEENGGTAIDSSGRVHYLGLFEDETVNGYEDFVTLGAKKYAYNENGKLHITIAGVGKKKGAVELGDIHNFKPGFIFRDAGGTESVYNDNVHYEYFIDGRYLLITDNVVIRPSTYELGITEEYRRVLQGAANIKYSDHDIPGLYKMPRP